MKYVVIILHGCFASRLHFGLVKAFRDGLYATLSVESQTYPGSSQPMPHGYQEIHYVGFSSFGGSIEQQ